MKLTIEIEAIGFDVNRRVINNLLANSTSFIHYKIMKTTENKIELDQKFGDKDFTLKIKIE